MKRLCLALLGMFIFSYAAFAAQLNGGMDNHEDGTYSVTLKDKNNHEYQGTAEDNGDGTLTVSVHDKNGETYTGTATYNSDGVYTLNLYNEATGVTADGMVTEN